MELYGLSLLVGLATGIGGWFLLRMRNPGGALHRRIEKGVEHPPASAPHGHAQLSGEAGARVLLQDPLTEDDVVAYRLLLEESYGAAWVPMAEQVRVSDFTLNARPGRARITGAEAVLLLDRSRATGQGNGHKVPVHFAIPLSSADNFDQRFFRWTSFHIRPGDEVFVDGQVERIPDAEGDAQLGAGHAMRAAPSIAEVKSSPRKPVIISDLPKARLLEFLKQEGQELLRLLPLTGRQKKRKKA